MTGIATICKLPHLSSRLASKLSEHHVPALGYREYMFDVSIFEVNCEIQLNGRKPYYGRQQIVKLLICTRACVPNSVLISRLSRFWPAI